MKNSEINLTPNEKMIRRTWAVLTVILTILMVYLQNLRLHEMGAHTISMAIASILPLIVWQYITFHFIFFKHGTKLLTFILFWMPISCVISFTYSYKMGFMDYKMIGSWVLTAIWYGLLWKMRKINRRIKAQKKLIPQN